MATRAANDYFVQYYSERIWSMIPSVYRHEDGLGTNPGVLRGIVEVIAAQAAILRRSQDRLWEDQHIDLCDDWAVPYIGDLIGTRLLSAQLKRARRIDVAKTIYYRRNNGTPRVLEELISDISGWDGKLVESFHQLGRARHGLDPQPSRYAGRFTGTMPGGWADLRSPVGSELANGPFDEYYHVPDMRKAKGVDGRYGIAKVNFYLYPLESYSISLADPFPMGDGVRYTFDPSGRSIPLFSRRNRPTSINGWNDWHSAQEWELPLAIRCRLLGHAEYQISAAAILDLAVNHGLSSTAESDLKTIVGHTFKNELALSATIGTFPTAAELQDPNIFTPLLKASIIKNCGKNQLMPSSINLAEGNPLKDMPKELAVAAKLADATWTVNAPLAKEVAIDAEQGRLSYLNGKVVDQKICVSYHYGAVGPIGAGTYNRSTVEDSEATLVIIPGGGSIGASEMISTGVVQIEDNRSYTISSDHPAISNFVLQAANQRRPYIEIQNDWILSAGANTNALLMLDGLWICGKAGKQYTIIIRGAFECVTIRNCTIDPGGDTNANGETIFPVTLVIEGSIEKLCIDHAIVGPIQTSSTGIIEDRVSISDSIVQSIDPTVEAVEINTALVELENVTVFGKLTVHRLYASNALITDSTLVTDTQTGCFRFSAAPNAPVSRIPRPYQSYLFGSSANHWFTSVKFGQPGYGQLSETSPKKLRNGAENAGEMGAFSSLLTPLKLEGLQTKVDEYMPFGLIPSYINAQNLLRHANS